MMSLLNTASSWVNDEDSFMNSSLERFLMLAGIAYMATTLSACGGQEKPPPDKPVASVTVNTPIEVTAEDYIEEWRMNPHSAIRKYVGMPVKLTGIVDHVVDGMVLKTKSSIIFKGRHPANLELAQAIFPHDRLPDIRKLKEGTKITVTCTGIKNIMLPSCENSSIVR